MLAGAMVALTLVAQCRSLATPDMGFLLYAAGRILGGARLYRDLIEINPPLIVAFNLPVEWLARVLGISDFLVYRLATALVLAAVLLLCRRLLARYAGSEEPAARRYVLLLLTFALFPLARGDFGEREHIVLALLLPYVVLSAARVQGRAPSRADAIASGAMAGAALALKPPFALAWVAIKAYGRIRRPELRRAVTAETASVIAFLILYAIAAVVLTPEYLWLVAQLGPAYATYLRESFYRLLVLGPGAALVWFSLLAAVACRRAARRPEVWGVLASTVMGCFLAAGAQQKGLGYHFYPAVGLAFVLLGLVAAEAGPLGRLKSERLYALISPLLAWTIVIVIGGGTLLSAVGGGPGERRTRAELLERADFVRRHAGGEPIGVLSYHIGSAFPLVNYAGVRLASRFPHLWVLPASYWDALHADDALRYRAIEAMPAPERFMFDAVREDLVAVQPRVLLVLRPARDAARNGLRRLRYVRYFGQQPELAELFSRYQLIGLSGEYEIYERLDRGVGRTGPAPSDRPGTQDLMLGEPGRIRLGMVEPEFVAFAAVLAAVWLIWLVLVRARLPSRERPGGEPGNRVMPEPAPAQPVSS